MNNAQYILLSKETGYFRQIGVIANNMANMNTTGFKADEMLYQNFSVKMNTPDHKPKKIDYANDIGTYTDTTQGPMQETGNPLDFAIKGPGYFIIQSPLGVRYTRAGDFTLDGNGQLTTPQGYPVLGPDFQPIVFQPQDKDIQVYADGTITARQDGSTTPNTRGQIGVVTFPSAAALQKLPNGLISGPGNGSTVIPAPNTFEVAQGIIEKSNVDAVIETTKLIEVNRNSALLSQSLGSLHDMEIKALDTINKQ